MNPLDLLNPDIRALLLAEAKAQLLAEGQIPAFEPKPKKLTPAQEKRLRVQAMVRRWQRKDFEVALKTNAAEIADIQKEMPGWLPTAPGTHK